GVSQKTLKQSIGMENATNPVPQLSGRTDGDLITFFDGDPALVGQIVNVKVESALPLALSGKLLR
ncbi:MAG: TRAM domain-containing protein, partial [Planctomycetota bacterium]